MVGPAAHQGERNGGIPVPSQHGLSVRIVRFGHMAAPAAQRPQQTARSVGWSIPSDGEIRRILIDRVDTQRQTLGIVVGVIDSNGQRTISYGALNQNDARQLNGDTEFEIGSITKVFTSLLWAGMCSVAKLRWTIP